MLTLFRGANHARPTYATIDCELPDKSDHTCDMSNVLIGSHSGMI